MAVRRRRDRQWPGHTAGSCGPSYRLRLRSLRLRVRLRVDLIENKDDNQIDGLHVGKVVLIQPPSSYPPGTYVIRRLESDG